MVFSIAYVRRPLFLFSSLNFSLATLSDCQSFIPKILVDKSKFSVDIGKGCTGSDLITIVCISWYIFWPALHPIITSRYGNNSQSIAPGVAPQRKMHLHNGIIIYEKMHQVLEKNANRDAGSVNISKS
ncbi:hypothetical protein L2E82_01550 [Cichorium intybus]|uniref:Uncharacterized protein n=1 Tax=Cichorium intybus TaxID=13427 RepID=A0ACB9GZ64_CICIN|nr:hypothetical protein L2E82_01550 [Cichorium intybus]